MRVSKSDLGASVSRTVSRGTDRNPECQVRVRKQSPGLPKWRKFADPYIYFKTFRVTSRKFGLTLPSPSEKLDGLAE